MMPDEFTHYYGLDYSNYYEVESLYQIKHDEFKKKVTRALSKFEAL